MTRDNKPDTYRSSQGIQNWSFDEEYKTLVFQQMAFDGANLVRVPSKERNVHIVETTDYIYICYSPVGTALSESKWQIKRTEVLTGSTMYADANSNYDNVATDPASLSYSYS